MNRRILAIAILIPFTLLTLYAVSRVGYIGIFEYHLHSPAGWQVITDLVIALILVGFGTVMIWAPPADFSGALLVGWMVLALLVYETASTAFLIPHGALGMELTPGYHERTRLFGYVHMIGFIGSVLGNGVMYVFSESMDQWVDKDHPLIRYGGLALILMVAVILERRYRFLKQRYQCGAK